MPRPWPQNVPGDWYVETGCCTLCAIPTDTAPELFKVQDDTHCYVARQPETPQHLGQMLDAAKWAEFECIRYRGRSPDVLARLIQQGDARLIDRFQPHPDNAPGGWYVLSPDLRDPCRACALPDLLPDLIQRGADGCRVSRQADTARDQRRMMIAAIEAACGCLRYRGRDPAVTAWLTDQGGWDLIDPA